MLVSLKVCLRLKRKKDRKYGKMRLTTEKALQTSMNALLEFKKISCNQMHSNLFRVIRKFRAKCN